MSYFVWGNDLKIDNGPLDADHRKLVDLVNELHTATSQGSGQVVVGKILDSLISYTQEHFDREERQMELHHFPKLAAHKQQHAEMMKEVARLKDEFDVGSITVASKVSAMLRDWLSLHIRRSDKELVRHLKKVGK